MHPSQLTPSCLLTGDVMQVPYERYRGVVGKVSQTLGAPNQVGLSRWYLHDAKGNEVEFIRAEACVRPAIALHENAQLELLRRSMECPASLRHKWPAERRIDQIRDQQTDPISLLPTLELDLV